MIWLWAILLLPMLLAWAFSQLLRRQGEIRVTSLRVYPIKSCGGIDVQSAAYDRLGLENDRRFLVVSTARDTEEEPLRFLTQRQHPRMALIQPSLPQQQQKDGSLSLLVDAPGMPRLRVQQRTPQQGEETLTVKVWDDELSAVSCGDEATKWFSDYLGVPAALLSIVGVKQHRRRIDPIWDTVERDPAQDISAPFADGYPFLLASEESLDDLNSRLAPKDKVTMAHFRPNLIVKGGGVPWDEDYWVRFAIVSAGSSDEQRKQGEFDVVKPCSRCSIPNIDPLTGVRSAVNEPTATLQKFRSTAGKVFFGQNLVHRQAQGRISVGDSIVILQRSRRSNLSLVAQRKKAEDARDEALKKKKAEKKKTA